MPAAIQEGTYLEGLLKNIPSESVGSYLAITSFLTQVPEGTRVWLHWVIFVLILGTTPLWRLGSEPKLKWWQHMFACIAFVIWAMTLGAGGAFGTIPGFEAYIGGIFLVLFSAVIFPLLSKLFVHMSKS